jgi:predicted nucleotidyltransferase
MRNIMDALREHKERVLQDYTEDQLLGVFLYGSQNYGISTENSDVDTKAILIPTVQDLVLGKPISREVHLENGEHCEVKDIRELIRMFEKQNINFLEILFTDYCLINRKYNRIWREYFVNNAELIAHMNEHRAIVSLCSQVINSLKQNKTDGKKFANGLRLYRFLEKYLAGANYSEAIDVSVGDTELAKKLIDYKRGLIIVDEKETDKLIDKFSHFLKIADSYDKTPNPRAVEVLREGSLALITNEQNEFDFYK